MELKLDPIVVDATWDLETILDTNEAFDVASDAAEVQRLRRKAQDLAERALLQG